MVSVCLFPEGVVSVVCLFVSCVGCGQCCLFPEGVVSVVCLFPDGVVSVVCLFPV